MAVAPGIVWQRATPSWKVASSSHFFRSTAILRMYATIAGPPKAVVPSLRKDRNNRGKEGGLSVSAGEESIKAISRVYWWSDSVHRVAPQHPSLRGERIVDRRALARSAASRLGRRGSGAGRLTGRRRQQYYISGRRTFLLADNPMHRVPQMMTWLGAFPGRDDRHYAEDWRLAARSSPLSGGNEQEVRGPQGGHRAVRESL